MQAKGVYTGTAVPPLHRRFRAGIDGARAVVLWPLRHISARSVSWCQRKPADETCYEHLYLPGEDLKNMETSLS